MTRSSKKTRPTTPGFFHFACLIALAGLSTEGVAQSPEGEPAERGGQDLSLDRIGLDLSNPVTGLRHLAWDIEYFTYQGSLPEANEQTGSRSVFTPTWPIKLSNGKNLLLRATIPINGDLPNWKPVFFLDYAEFLLRQLPTLDESVGGFQNGHDHMGDIGIDIGYGGVNENGLISMFGVSLVAPTSEDQSARRNQWLVGPEVSLGRVTNWGLYGVRAKHLTNVKGEGVQEVEPYDTNETTLKLFFAYGLGNGWQIESNPTILYDWEAISDNEWHVPIGAGIAKTFKMGRVPVKLGFELQHFVVSTDRLGPEWLFRLSLTPVMLGRYLD